MYDKNPEKGFVKQKKIIYQNGSIKCKVFNRDLLKPGNRITGPALLYEYSSTSFIPPDYAATIDEYENIIIRIKQI